MPKLKTNRGAAKRFRATAKKKSSGTGKRGFKCRSANRSHHFTCKTTKSKRHARAGFRVRKEDSGRIEQMMPYV